MLRSIMLLAGIMTSTMIQAMTVTQYQAIQQPGLDKAQLTFADIQPILAEHQRNPLFQFQQIGQSVAGTPVFQITVGSGKHRILAWSQMHGNESTATAALMDLLNFISADEQQSWREKWLSQVTLRIIPMVNPDGAEKASRFNAQGIDINRDAKALQSPEGRFLLAAAEEFKPHFGFNLHDQNRHHGVGDSDKPATISLLAPAFNTEKTIDESRKKAMQLIGEFAHFVEQTIPGHLGRYDDTFSIRSFGDTFSGMGISTILIESGGYPADDNRQIPRRINTQLLILAIESIVSERYAQIPLEVYNSIPFNRSGAIKDLLITGLRLDVAGQPGLLDLAFNHEGSASNQSRINDIGDLSIYGSYHKFDATGLSYQPGKAYVLQQELILTAQKHLELLRQGYSHFTGDRSLLDNQSRYPVLLNPERLPAAIPQRQQRAVLLMRDEQAVRFAVLDGQVIDLSSGDILNSAGT